MNSRYLLRTHSRVLFRPRNTTTISATRANFISRRHVSQYNYNQTYASTTNQNTILEETCICNIGLVLFLGMFIICGGLNILSKFNCQILRKGLWAESDRGNLIIS